MTKRMLIDAAHADETRVVLLDNDVVYDYDFVSSSKAQNKGNIYLAKITRVEPSLQAAFVEYGGGKQGFLPFSEIHPDYYQLTADDKAKLLAEQIAEAEAEEAAEDEAFEREQAAREARRRGGRSGSDTENEGEDDEFVSDDDSLLMEAPSVETVVALNEMAAADSAVVASMPELPPVVIPAHSFDTTPANQAYNVEPLNAESFAVHSDPLPEDTQPIDERNTEATTAEEGTDSETTAEDGEETRKRGDRGERSTGRTAFHRRYRIQEVIKRNQIVLVQVIKEERGNKGCSLTTFISLAGRAAVLMPNSPKGGGISRKITDRETRNRLKEVAAEMRTHRGMSVIIRTAGIDRTKAEIRRDYEYLVKLWNQIREQTLASSAPALIYEEGNLIKRSLRDLYTSDVEEVIVEGEPAFNEAKDFMKMLMP
ncbi:MAG: ribonuclease E/G, partial [Rickettsiales bacterium]